jgi:hypothetical protein
VLAVTYSGTCARVDTKARATRTYCRYSSGSLRTARVPYMLVECFLRVKGRMVMIDVMRMLCVLSISCRGSMHRCGLIPAPSCEVGGRPSSDAVAVAAAVVATLVAATEITFWGWIRTDPLYRLLPPEKSVDSSIIHISHSSFLIPPSSHRLIPRHLHSASPIPIPDHGLPSRPRFFVLVLVPAAGDGGDWRAWWV